MNAIAQASSAPVTGPKLDNRRVLAGIVDLLIVSAGAVVILFAGDALTGDRGEVRGALGAVILGWALYYFFALESGDGQTVGKKLMNLRVIRADGSPAGMREIAVRTVLRVIDNYLVGLIVMLATGERRQRLGDLAAGTMVADAAMRVTPAAAVDEAVVEETEVAEDGIGDADADVADAGEPEPVAQTATITLPARPSRPATLADIGGDAPAAPEMRPFPPVDRPAEEEPVAEELDPVVADEPIAEDEPVAPYAPIMAEDEPVAPYAPIMAEDEPVAPYAPIMAEDAELEHDPVVADEPVADAEPVVEDDPVVADELPEITSPSIEELARDVSVARETPEAEVEDVEDVEDDSVVADEVDADDDQPVVVRSVETVSAIDLVMGGGAEDAGSDEPAQDPEAPASH